jgi:PAS domain S-box-containing protein
VAAAFNGMLDRRQEADGALQESERRFATLLSNAPTMVYRCANEPGWPFEFVSAYVYELTGHPAADFLEDGLQYESLIVEEDRERVWDEVQAGLAARERFRISYAVRHRNGAVRRVEEYGQGIFGEDGTVLAIEGLVADVTEREQAVEMLREAEVRYRSLVENIPAVVYTQQPGEPSLTTYVSPQIEAMQGYTPQETMSDPEHWTKTLHPEDRERVLAEDERTNRTGEPFVAEYRQFARDGRVVWVRDEAVLVRDEAGTPLYWQGVLLDTTERKRAEEAVKENEKRFRQLFDQSVDALIIHDASGNIVDCNAEACRALGYSREELLALR